MSEEKNGAGGKYRRLAEEQVTGMEERGEGALEPAELARSMHELLVHQVELELQNEELVEARSELEQNAALLKDLYDFAPVGYFSITADGMIRKLNFTGARMLGSERGRLVGRSFTKSLVQADQTVFERFLAGVFDSESREPCEVRISHHDGSESIASLRGALSTDGLVCRMAAMDVTEQRHLEAETRAKIEDLDRIFNLSHDLLAIIGPDGCFRRINPAFHRVLGFSPEMMAGCDLLRLVHPDDLEVTRQIVERLKAGEEIVDFVNRYRSKEGGFRWLEWRITPYGDQLMCAVARDITERQEAENALRESEERLRHFIEHAPAGVAMLDRNLRYLAATKRWKNDHELSGDPRADDDPSPEIPEQWKNALRPCLAGETLRKDEDEFHRADGSVRWLSWEARPWRAADGQIGGILVAAEDITERVKGREALSASEKRLRLAINAAQLGTWDWDLRNDEVLWNARHEIIMGYKPGTPHRSYADFVNRVHPEDATRVTESLRSAIENDAEYSCEFRVVWPDGSIRWVSGFGRALTDSEGKTPRMLGIIMDVTERMEAAQALRRSEEKFRSIVESSPSAIHLYQLYADDRLILMEGNPSADKALGIDHSALLGKTLENAFPGISNTPIPGIYRAVARGELETQQFEIEYHEGGISGCFEVYVFQTNPNTIAVIFSDISERRKAREALEKNQEELESRVQRRTAQLHVRTRQLRALADELAQAEERERRRIAGLIHEDLQQMLVAALVNMGMLKSRVSDKDSEAEFSQIEGILRDSVQTARSLTAELSPPVLQQCGLGAALKWLRTWCGEKYAMDVRVEVDEDDDLKSEVGVSLFRCVRELLFNTVKHAGVRSAELRMWRVNGDVVKIEVRDEGVGFDPEEVRAREGSVGGFGLFSIRERLELLGGGFEIESSPGAGSRFTLWVPARIDSHDADSGTITAGFSNPE
jgi:PAS domain S-box-containing protein